MNEKFLPTTSRIMVTIVAIGLCQMGIGALSAAAQGNPEPPSGEQSVRDDMRAGRDLTPEEVASLEAILVNDPNAACNTPLQRRQECRCSASRLQ